MGAKAAVALIHVNLLQDINYLALMWLMVSVKLPLAVIAEESPTYALHEPTARRPLHHILTPWTLHPLHRLYELLRQIISLAILFFPKSVRFTRTA
jgi:hypothetical protein